jgi:hypothetical protein
MGIPEIDKAPLTWCRHCEIGVGCKIYEERPGVCRSFYCRYMLTPSLGEHWKPSNCNMVLTFDRSSKTLAIRVDPDHAKAWRQEPYFSEIKAWAAVAWHDNGQVIVWQGDVAIAMLPHGEKVLGHVREDQGIMRTTVQGPTGKMFDAKVVDRPGA